jgi:hypothetical protein
MALLAAVPSMIVSSVDARAGSPALERSAAGTGVAVEAVEAVEAVADLNNMWARHANRSGYATMCDDWSGGDGTQSVLLPNGRRAYFFSDTYLGDPTLRPTFDRSLLRNSIVVQEGTDPATANPAHYHGWQHLPRAGHLAPDRGPLCTFTGPLESERAGP